MIGNGASVNPNLLIKLAKNHSIVALDGGYLLAKEAKLQVHLVIGDIDSLLKETTNNIDVIQKNDQETTDLEKGLHYLANQKADTVTICCATGNEEDHTLYNFSLLKKFHDSFKKLRIISNLQTIQYLHNTTLKLDNQAGKNISLFGFPSGHVKTEDLAYPINSTPLEYFMQNSVRNQIKNNHATLEILGDVLMFLSSSSISKEI